MSRRQYLRCCHHWPFAMRVSMINVIACDCFSDRRMWWRMMTRRQVNETSQNIEWRRHDVNELLRLAACCCTYNPGQMVKCGPAWMRACSLGFVVLGIRLVLGLAHLIFSHTSSPQIPAGPHFTQYSMSKLISKACCTKAQNIPCIFHIINAYT